ncbi:hypothetical protein KOSB73_220488 [Klebsiella grimontii]|uniref:Uncharacterized protein n=1 Tax=Klebsiella grimontii TaxID=2058152 RepID=A0A285B073_9ENTR|nr:hypothetical protein KOSB73_220488 [Klebsiella grimontii]
MASGSLSLSRGLCAESPCHFPAARIYRLAGGDIPGGGEWVIAHKKQRMMIACEFYVLRDDKFSHKKILCSLRLRKSGQICFDI